MKKCDFIQQTSAQFLPALNWDLNKAIGYAEKLWQRLDERGYGEPKKAGPREIQRAYDKLDPLQKAAFDLFWSAFDYKHGRDRAALAWLKHGKLNKDDHQRIIAGAKREAIRRKQLADGLTPAMAELWLNERRWLDGEQTTGEQQQKQQNASAAKIREITQALAHAKKMSGNTTDEYWPQEVQRLSEKLRQMRDNQ